MEYRAQDLYDYHVSQMQREEYDMDDPLQLGRYSPEVFDRVEGVMVFGTENHQTIDLNMSDPATSYQPAETHFFEDAIFSFNDPANRRSDEDSISRSTRTGQGNRPASLAVTERVIKNRDTGRDVDPGVASNPFMGLIKAVREKTKRNDALVVSITTCPNRVKPTSDAEKERTAQAQYPWEAVQERPFLCLASRRQRDIQCGSERRGYFFCLWSTVSYQG